MSRFALLILAVQACLLQNAYACGCGLGGLAGTTGIGYGLAGPYGYGTEIVAPLGLGLAGPGLGLAGPGYGLGPYAAGPAYGGVGVGEVAVAGELGVSGITAVAGQVPILGSVEFGGVVPAAGSVTITGSCACGCGGPYVY